MSRYRDDDDYGRGRGGPAREYDDYNRERYGGRGDDGVDSRRGAREIDDFEYRNRPRYDEREDYAPPRAGYNRATPIEVGALDIRSQVQLVAEITTTP